MYRRSFETPEKLMSDPFDKCDVPMNRGTFLSLYFSVNQSFNCGLDPFLFLKIEWNLVVFLI